jgi:hypothetical protein
MGYKIELREFMDYNPYDLLLLEINGVSIDGRPIDFDGDPINNSLAIPTKVATVCPNCGQGLEFDVQLSNPPFSVIARNCYLCNVEKEIISPFVNPLDTGEIQNYELEPLLYNPEERIVDDGKSVAERLDVDEKGPESFSTVLDDQVVLVPKIGLEEKGKTKEELEDMLDSSFVCENVSGPIVPLEPAEGIGAEEDFDDEDMVEDE